MRKLKYLLLITIPITIIFLVWISDTLEMLIQSKRIGNSDTTLIKQGLVSFYDIKNNLLNKNTADVNILINPKKLLQLKSETSQGKLNYQKAYMIIDKEIYTGKIKARGDSPHHWINKYKSYRFKTNKNSLYDDKNKINFINLKKTKLLNNHLSYKVANMLDLVSPTSKIVTFSINGEIDSLKLMIEQIDESFLRNNKIMPIDIYNGDNLGGDRLIFNDKKYGDTSLFKNYSIWKKKSYNNHYPKESMQPLKRMIQNIYKNDYSILDLYEFAKFSAFIDIVETKHFDVGHNWLMYYDNYKEKMVPIVWDAMGFNFQPESTTNTINISTSLLLDNLYHNYDFLRYKYDVLNDFFINSETEFFSMLDLEFKKIIHKINLHGFSVDQSINYTNAKDNIKILKQYQKNLVERYLERKNKLFPKLNNNNYGYTENGDEIRISINGNNLIKGIIFKLKKVPKTLNSKISYKNNNIKISEQVFPILDEKKLEIKIPISLLPSIKLNTIEETFPNYLNSIMFNEATFDFDIVDSDLVKEVYLEFQDGNTIKVKEKNQINEQSFHNVFNIVTNSKNNKVVIWEGEKNIKGFNTVNDNIIIKPGTKIIFDENSTLKSLGRITAIGTKEKPIIFEAKDITKPWNSIVIKDIKANGSVFKHCIFKNGSGDKGELYEYTGMLSIHNVKDFLVEDSAFYDNHKTDDMVHVIYSEGKFKNTRFVRSLSDALDIDISNVTIDNCKFIDSGNDAIDLMTTNALVTNTTFINSKDKGISIGEGSKLLAINNNIKGSEIGVQSKDTSNAYIYNTSFIGNKKAVDAYHKNWRYQEGGSIILNNCVFKNNIVNATVGKKSKVTISDSNIDTPDNFNLNSLRKRKIIITDDTFIPYNLKEPIFKNKSNLINKEKRGYNE